MTSDDDAKDRPFHDRLLDQIYLFLLLLGLPAPWIDRLFGWTRSVSRTGRHSQGDHLLTERGHRYRRKYWFGQHKHKRRPHGQR